MTAAQKEANRRWREAHPEQFRKYQREFMRKYRKKYPERVRATARKHYHNNIEELRELYRQKYRDGLPETREAMRQQHFSYIRSIKGNLLQKWQSFQARVRGQISQYLNCKGMDVFDKKEFIETVMKNPRFKKLWRQYERSKFSVNYAPAFYRIDTDEGYIANNLVMLARGEWSKQAVMREAKAGRII